MTWPGEKDKLSEWKKGEETMRKKNHGNQLTQSLGLTLLETFSAIRCRFFIFPI